MISKVFSQIIITAVVVTNFYVLINRTYVRVKATMAAKARKKKLRAAIVSGLLKKLNKVQDK